MRFNRLTLKGKHTISIDLESDDARCVAHWLTVAIDQDEDDDGVSVLVQDDLRLTVEAVDAPS